MNKNIVRSKGIEVSFTQDGNTIEIQDDKSMVVISKHGRQSAIVEGIIKMTIEIDRTEISRGEFFVLERQKTVRAVPLKDKSDDPHKRIFVHNIIVRFDENLYLAQGAHLELLEVYKNGRFKIWEVGMTKRRNKFFFVLYKARDERAYRDEQKKIVIPALDRWQSLRKILWLSDYERTTEVDEQEKAAMARGDKEFVWPHSKDLKKLPPNLLDPRNRSLKPVAKYVPTRLVTGDGLAKNQGRILHWSECKGLGFIITASGETARVYHANLVDQESLPNFVPGDLVTFVELAPPSDRRTKIKFDALRVALV